MAFVKFIAATLSRAFAKDVVQKGTINFPLSSLLEWLPYKPPSRTFKD